MLRLSHTNAHSTRSLFFPLLLLCACAAHENAAYYLDPLWFRSQATFAPPPIVPEAFQAHDRTHLVVVEATVGPKGDVLHARILETQHPALAGPALAAVQKWQFGNLRAYIPDARSQNRIGRAIFYFTMGGTSREAVDAAGAALEKFRRKKLRKESDR